MNTVMLIFFGTLAVAVAVYYLFPKRLRWTVLLFFSALFCVIVSTYLFAFFLATAASVYAAARFLLRPAPEGADEQTQKKFARRNKAFTALVIVFNLAIIGVLKYANFFGGMFNSLLALTGTQFRFPALSLALPLGISFYTLTAIGYMVDVYRGKYAAERNFAKVCLFLCFFPAILEGPICRYDQTAPQLFEGHDADYRGMLFGAQRILWGLFKKMVVADRLYLLVRTVADAPDQYTGYAGLLFMLCYTIQLYADFSGFIDIALGSAELFGVRLPENFPASAAWNTAQGCASRTLRGTRPRTICRSFPLFSPPSRPNVKSSSSWADLSPPIAESITPASSISKRQTAQSTASWTGAFII